MVRDVPGGGSAPLAPPPPPNDTAGPRVVFAISEAEMVDGLRRVRFYWPLVEQFVEQIPPEDLAYLVSYLAACVVVQDKDGAVTIKGFTPPFTEYYRALVDMVQRQKGQDPTAFWVLEPLEQDLKGAEDGWREGGAVQ